MESKDLVSVNMSKKERIFPPYKNIDRSKLLITNVGMYSVSKIKGSQFLINILKRYFKNTNITITDATGNVGSDTINLAIHFKHVNSIEMSIDQFLVLKHNVSVYGLKNVTLINGNSLTVLPTLKQSVIYIDAPWGGIDYLQNDKIKLYLDDKELSQIYNEYKQYCKLIIFKVPKNYDFVNFKKHCLSTNIKIIPYNVRDHISFYFIVCL